MDGESDSIMSSASENSTEPWFCDACKNGVTPSCELCPNQDGIFKETDAGRWDADDPWPQRLPVAETNKLKTGACQKAAGSQRLSK